MAQNNAAVSLRCEHLHNPVGIDAVQPRFSWAINKALAGVKQSAYKIWLGTAKDVAASSSTLHWQSGKIASPYAMATYQGPALQPFTRYYWKVELWDEQNKVLATSDTATFETGMMGRQLWKGAWISDDHGIYTKPAPLFRTTFPANSRIIAARAYIAAGGLYELYINGKKIGNHALDPAYTRFDRRNLYVTHDVTAALQEGRNAVGVMLGNGWYNHQSTAVWNFHNAPWRARPAFCLDLRITYEDGSVHTIASGKEWKTALGPVIFNSIYTAEHYDARLEQKDWCSTNFNDSAWKSVTFRSAPSANITAQAMYPVRHAEAVSVKTINQLNDTTWVFDIGRNISGVSRLVAEGPAGTVLKLKHGERLYKNGHVDLSNIDVHYRPQDDKDPFQTDIFILGGNGKDTFMPRFNYKGFQYVEVTANAPVPLSKESLTAYFMHSDVPAVGAIHTSNNTINKIWEATNNSYLSNLFGYPTDCPQREKNGWTGDAHFAIETGLYNFDAITVYDKWMADHRDEQQPNGVLPSIIPTGGWGYEWGNGPDWTSTIAIIPWTLYLFYGDSKPLADCYEHLKRYVNHINNRYPSGTTSWGLGDWIPVKSKASVELTSTAYYFTDVTILAKAAKLLGKKEDAVFYNQLAQKIKAAFNQKFFNSTTGIYGTGIQTEMSVPLHLGLVPSAQKATVAKNLAARVALDGARLDVGLLGTKSILNALSENGYGDVAYTLAAREDFPSWGWWIKNGATTLYENWPIDAASDISLNHIMFGEIGAWLYKGLGGIRPDEAEPGFKNVLLQPTFAKDLKEFEASHFGPYGLIKSAWVRRGKSIVWKVEVPPNSTADISFPDGTVTQEGRRIDGAKPYHVEAGSYAFEIKEP